MRESCVDVIAWFYLQFFNTLQPLQDQFCLQSLTSNFVNLQKVE